MQHGGNAKIHALFREAGVPKALTVESKYDSNTAEEYRKRLKLVREGELMAAWTLPEYVPPPPEPTKKVEIEGRTGSMASIKRADSDTEGLTPLECWHRRKYGYASNDNTCRRCVTWIASQVSWFLCLNCQCLESYQPVPGSSVPAGTVSTVAA
jgi:hypothetical protein